MATAPTARDTKPSKKSSCLGLIVSLLATLYTVVLTALCFVLYLESDRWWPATLILFGPRWVWLVPFVILTPAAVACRRWLPRLHVLLQVVLAVPLLGFVIPWSAWRDDAPDGPSIRLLTCNIHFDQLNAPALRDVIVRTQPDLVLLQGWDPRHEAVLFPTGQWHVVTNYHLCFASRFPVMQVETLDDDPDFKTEDSGAARYHVAAPHWPVWCANFHLASPRSGLEEFIQSRGREGGAELDANSALRRRQAEKACRWLEDCDGPLLLGGDFNTPIESTIYQDHWTRFTNAFKTAGWGLGWTHYTRRSAVRIDHLLAGPGWHCRRSWVEVAVGSPHRPVVAEWWQPAGPQ